MALNVLVVDDNRIMREMVAKAVAMSGLDLGRIDQAGNGQEALFKLGAGGIGLVMLDINMPVMNGEQLLAAVRSSPKLSNVIVVVVSTESSLPRIERLKGMGAGFVHKPFKAEHLVAEVRRLQAGTP
jgi:two-component system chemotaxis response regulator CheY